MTPILLHPAVALVPLVLGQLLEQNTLVTTSWGLLNGQLLEQNTLVTTSRGLLSGQVFQARGGRDYWGFTGVPYAEPPLGSRRFLVAEPAGPWSEVLDATTTPPACPQAFAVPGVERIRQDEDCLYLNVYTPRLTNEPLLPVMMWIFGGGFANGHPGLANSSRYFLDEDVVLVAPNYRLGTLGFLSFEDDIMPGNLGLKDLALAIDWTRSEIVNFGGDPDRITLFGHGAGAVASQILCSVPRIAGLVVGCISQSGTEDAFWARKQPGAGRREAQELASAVGCTEDPLPCLQSLPVERITNFTLLQSTDSHPVAPVLEPASAPGALLTEWPARTRGFPWITGVNQEEGVLFTWYYEYNATQEERGQFIENFNTTVVDYLHLENRTDQIPRIRERFFTDGVEPLVAIRNFYTEVGWVYPALRSLAQHDGPRYLYVFNYTEGPSRFRRDKTLSGAAHGDELPFFFDFPYPNVPEEWPRQRNLQLSQILISLWVNFARIQQPATHLYNGSWIQFQDGDYLRIDNTRLRMDSTDNYQEIINFWDSVFEH